MANQIIFTLKNLKARCDYHNNAMELIEMLAINKDMNFMAIGAFYGDTVSTSSLLDVRRRLNRLIESRMIKAILNAGNEPGKVIS